MSSPIPPGADPLPPLVRDFDAREGSAQALLSEFEKHVHHVTRTYPDAWFSTGRKEREAVVDLAHRAFTSCARVEKGRFPFLGRRPFRCYVEERFEGRTIRYHSFYAKLSITREIMRDDYARNLRRDPVLRWRAELFAGVGDVLKGLVAEGVVEEEAQGPALPPRYRWTGPGPRLAASLGAVEERLRSRGETDLRAIVRAGLERAGPLSRSKLTALAEAVIGTPEAEEPPVPAPAPPPGVVLGVRRAVKAAWDELEPEDRDLMIALARGDSYDELCARQPRLKHRVAVTRAVTRCGQRFLAAVAGEAGVDPEAGVGVMPKQFVEQVLEVLAELVPEVAAAHRGGAR
jgi:hypothetical protein